MRGKLNRHSNTRDINSFLHSFGHETHLALGENVETLPSQSLLPHEAHGVFNSERTKFAKKNKILQLVTDKHCR